MPAKQDSAPVLGFISVVCASLSPSSHVSCDGEKSTLSFPNDCSSRFVRILDFFSVHKFFGPFVTMIGRMTRTLTAFVILIMVFLTGFGVARIGLTLPRDGATWHDAKEIFIQPYIMLYGEVPSEEMDPPCGPPPEFDAVCPPGRFMYPIAMAVYLLVGNILIMNLLIAVMNNIFADVDAIANNLWMYNRYVAF